ncbi:MAG: ComF family protein [Acidimicrobiales bacterium]
MFFTTACSCCARPGPDPCAGCVDAMVVLAESDLGDLDPMLGEVFDRRLALVAYDDTVAQLVAALKFRRVRSAVPWIATAMADRLDAVGERPDVVTWVPASRRGRRRRGYDQGEILGRAVAHRLGVRACALLDRRDRDSQTGRDRAQRLDGPELVARRGRTARLVAGAHVVVIDDVVTTGASLAGAGAAVDDLGPSRLVGLALAHRCFVP